MQSSVSHLFRSEFDKYLVSNRHLLGLHLLLLLLQGGHLLGLTQGVDGDGKEDVEEGVVPKQGEEDEVGAVDLLSNDDKLQREDGIKWSSPFRWKSFPLET